mmetsp:Transcript_39031/g.92465  ORF Transcript_39031/g.92465 Transcript_39031/m.92465 type:complete len:216 (-) Transcript_39031:600-1247(-)
MASERERNECMRMAWMDRSRRVPGSWAWRTSSRSSPRCDAPSATTSTRACEQRRRSRGDSPRSTMPSGRRSWARLRGPTRSSRNLGPSGGCRRTPRQRLSRSSLSPASTSGRSWIRWSCRTMPSGSGRRSGTRSGGPISRRPTSAWCTWRSATSSISTSTTVPFSAFGSSSRSPGCPTSRTSPCFTCTSRSGGGGRARSCARSTLRRSGMSCTTS